MNDSVNRRVAALGAIVADAVRRKNWALDFGKLKEHLQLPGFDALGADRPASRPSPDAFRPKEQNSLVRAFFPEGTRGYRQRLARGSAAYDDALRVYELEESARKRRLCELQIEYQLRCDAEKQRVRLQNQAVDAFEEQYLQGHPVAVAKYFKTVLDGAQVPDGLSVEVDCLYSKSDGELHMEWELPSRKLIPDVASYRYIKTRDEIQSVPRASIQHDQLYQKLIAGLVVRALFVVFAADRLGHLRSALIEVRFPRDTRGEGLLAQAPWASVWCTRSGLNESMRATGTDVMATIRELGRNQDYRAHLATILLRRHGLPLHWEIVGQMAMEGHPKVFESRRSVLQVLQSSPHLFEPQGNGVYGLARPS